MNLAFVNSSIQLGGAETVARDLMQGCTAAGHAARLYVAAGKTYPRLAGLVPLYPRALSYLHHSRFQACYIVSIPIHNDITCAVAVPDVVRREIPKGDVIHDNLYNVVLLNDDFHSYEYVIEMLGKLFFIPASVAFRKAEEVDKTGRSIVITCELPQAQFAQDQIHAYGADPRMPTSKGSMSAILEKS